jgi:hypothetical protein
MMMPAMPKPARDNDCDGPCPPVMPVCETDASDASTQDVQDEVNTLTR